MAVKSALTAPLLDAGAQPVGIDPALTVPLYHQIFSILRDKIYEGQYPVDAFLPGEQELATHFHVSRITAKRALDEIAAAGMAVREQGRGTRVCIAPHSTSVRGSVEGLIHSLHANGRGTVQLLEFDYVPAQQEVADKLSLPLGEEVQRAIRIWHGREGPFSHLTTFVPAALGRRWHSADLEKEPLVSLLQQSGVSISRAEEQVTAILADDVAALCLKVNVGAPLLKIMRTVFDERNRAIEYVVALYPPDRYQFSLSLGR